jgi:hypothetical protein
MRARTPRYTGATNGGNIQATSQKDIHVKAQIVRCLQLLQTISYPLLKEERSMIAVTGSDYARNTTIRSQAENDTDE